MSFYNDEYESSDERELRRGEDEMAWAWDDLDYDERSEQFDMGVKSRFYGETFFAEEWCAECFSVVFLNEAGECSIDPDHEFKFSTDYDERENGL